MNIDDLKDYECEGQLSIEDITPQEPIWDIDYDYQKDEIIEVPTCPVCNKDKELMPYLINFETGKCENCGAQIDLTGEKIKKYIEDNTGHKEEEGKCFKCGGKMKITYYKHNGEWRTGGGQCESCGLRFIV